VEEGMLGPTSTLYETGPLIKIPVGNLKESTMTIQRTTCSRENIRNKNISNNKDEGDRKKNKEKEVL